MAIKKSELYSSLWKSCDELRGGMDASQYKDYVLVLLFVKYVSDKYAGNPHSLIEVPAGGSFADMVKLKGDKEIGDKLNTIIATLAEANGLTGVIDVADFNDQEKLGKGKEMVDRLSNLVSIFDSPGLNFKGNRAQGDDILGDAYEYLMRHFATESGKSKGQFYTPAEVSRVMSKVIGLAGATDSNQSIFDPTCGSGSLLLKAHDEAKAATGLDLAIYGQEMDNATSALAKMNMILHDCPTAEIWKDNTLAAPHFKDPLGLLKLFDFIVANPPFSTKAWSNGVNTADDPYRRFEYGIPPAKNGDYAFLLHILSSLKASGKAAVILPHGVLFRSGAEAAIRKRILQQGYIKGIIGLPANLFYGTPIPACILVLDKENSVARTGIFFIDASKGFIKDGNKNRLREQDIHKIVDTFTLQRELPKYSRLVPLAEVEANDFNLNIPRYIDASEAEDLQDIEAHLKGGIPERDLDAMDAYWQVIPGLRAALFAPLREGYSQLKVAIDEIKPTIFGHPEFRAFNQTVSGLFADWQARNRERLHGITIGDAPKVLIESLAEDLLETFKAAPLLDAYDVYQHLLDYWAATMQDDVYQLVSDGWQAQIVVAAGKRQPNTDLLPAELIVRRYFAAEAAAIEQLEAARNAISSQLEELDEEQGGEDGPLFDAKTDKGKLTAKSVKDRLKAIKYDPDVEEERNALNTCLGLLEQEAAAGKRAKEAQKALDAQVISQYGLLSEEDLKQLMVEDKWLASLAAVVQSELDRVSQALTRRIRELAERYATPLPQLNARVEELSAKVNQHLERMGFDISIQQLLTGQKRLPGFDEPWEVKPMRALGTTYGGLAGKTKKDFGRGSARYIPFMNVMADTVIDPDWLELVDVAANETQNLARKGDLFFNGSSETPEEVGFCSVLLEDVPNLYLNSFCFGFRLNADAKVNGLFLAYWFRGKAGRAAMSVLAQGATRYNISKSAFMQLEINLPSEDEQTAIANVLSDIDAEITAIEARGKKSRQIKQGMMQELLTGRVRLA